MPPPPPPPARRCFGGRTGRGGWLGCSVTNPVRNPSSLPATPTDGAIRRSSLGEGPFTEGQSSLTSLSERERESSASCEVSPLISCRRYDLKLGKYLH